MQVYVISYRSVYFLLIKLISLGKSTFLEAVKKKYIKGYKGMDLKYIPPTIGLNLGEIKVDKIQLNFFDLGENFIDFLEIKL